MKSFFSVAAISCVFGVVFTLACQGHFDRVDSKPKLVGEVVATTIGYCGVEVGSKNGFQRIEIAELPGDDPLSDRIRLHDRVFLKAQRGGGYLIHSIDMVLPAPPPLVMPQPPSPGPIRDDEGEPRMKTVPPPDLFDDGVPPGPGEGEGVIVEPADA